MGARISRSTAVGIRLSDVGKYLLDRLQEHHGISQASVVEMLLRDEARRQGITIPGSGSDLASRQEEADRLAGRARLVTPPTKKP